MPDAFAVTVYWLSVKMAVTVLLSSRLENVQVAAVEVPPVAAHPLHETVDPVSAVAVRIMEVAWSSRDESAVVVP